MRRHGRSTAPGRGAHTSVRRLKALNDSGAITAVISTVQIRVAMMGFCSGHAASAGRRTP